VLAEDGRSVRGADAGRVEDVLDRERDAAGGVELRDEDAVYESQR